MILGSSSKSKYHFYKNPVSLIIIVSHSLFRNDNNTNMNELTVQGTSTCKKNKSIC